MLNRLKNPTHSSADYYEQARFKLTWNINILLVITLLGLTIMFSVIEPKFTLHYALGTLMTTVSVVYMWISKGYKANAMVLCISSFILVSSSVLFIPNSVHYIEPFWIFIISLYAYFALGRYWGLAFLIGNILVTGAYFLSGMNANLVAFEELNFSQTITMVIEFSLCSVILGYIVHQFIQTNKYAEGRLKQANEQVRNEKKIVEQHAKEKTVLLQEIHHRVKNNLQVITSLLRMQSSKLVSEEAKMNFQDAIDRIMTMSLIHQKMYEKDNLEQIDLKDYVSSLAEDLIESGPLDNIQLSIRTEVDHVGTKSIVPLALLLTELISNSMKHAFVDIDHAPKISVSLTRKEGDADWFNFEYEDNGKWKEASKDSFGLELIDTLIEQLEGESERSTTEKGTRYAINLRIIDQN